MGVAIEEILVKLRFEAKEANMNLGKIKTKLANTTRDMQQKLNAVKADFFPQKQVIRKSVNDMRSQLNKLDFISTGTRRKKFSKQQSIMREQLVNKLQQSSIKSQKLMVKEQSAINNVTESYKPQIRALKKRIKIATVHQRGLDKSVMKQDKLSSSLKASQRPFAGWAMSLMFAGMAMKRAFDMIWKASTKTFQDIMHSVEGTVTEFDKLEGATTFLKFMAGQALEPVATALVPIISAISNWISNNEELFRSLVMGLGVIGSLVMFLGMFKLGIDGVVTATKTLKLVLGGISGVTLAILAASLIAIAAISWKAFKETPGAWEALRDVWKDLKPDILDGLKTIVTDLIKLVGIDSIKAWEDLAWAMVWVGDVGLKVFKALISSISLVINTISAAIRMHLLMADIMNQPIQALTGKGLEKNLNRIDTIIRGVISITNSISTIGTDVGGIIGASGLSIEERRRDYEHQQLMERILAEGSVRTQKGYGDTYEFHGDLYFQGNNMDEFREELRSLTT